MAARWAVGLVLAADVLNLLLRPLLVLVLQALQVVLLQVELPGQQRRLLVLLQLVLCQDRAGSDRGDLSPPET